MRIFRNISRIIPLSIQKKVTKFLTYANIKMRADMFIGIVIIYSVLSAVACGFFVGTFLKQSFLIWSLIGLGAINAAVFFRIQLIINKRTSLFEEALPDALQLMASNLKAGMTPDRALLLSSRPEFGPLKDEINLLGKKVALGESLSTALSEMAEHVPSRKLVRTVELINSGLKPGGSIVSLLESTSRDLRETQQIEEKIRANINMYVIFIFSAAAVIGPILFGLSSFLVEVLRSTFSNVDIPSSSVATLPIKITEISITPYFLNFFIVVFLIINSFLAATFLGLIAKGKRSQGIPYFIPIAGLAIGIFLLSRFLIKTLLGGLFNF